MNRTEVFVSENAFLSIVVAAIEVFRKETLGILMGYICENSIVVENAIPYQTSDRYASEVQRNHNAHKRIESFLEHVRSPAKIIGDFHSHTQFGDNRGGILPSKEDIDEMRNGGVYFIIEINNKSKSQVWNYNRDGTMSGSVGEYYLKLAAWYRDEKTNKPVLGKICCPFGLGFNWSYI